MVTESNGSTEGARRTKGLTRRGVVKGAVWSLPVVAMAMATPLAAASTTPLACPLGVLPAVQAVPQVSTTAVVLGNTGQISLAAGTVRVDTTALSTAIYGATATIAVVYTLTMSSGTTHTAVGANLPPIAIGSVADLPSTVFRDVKFPNGTYTSAPNAQRPTQLTATVTFEFTPEDGSTPISCPYVLSWTLNTAATGVVIFGAGTLDYTGTVAPI